LNGGEQLDEMSGGKCGEPRDGFEPCDSVLEQEKLLDRLVAATIPISEPIQAL